MTPSEAAVRLLTLAVPETQALLNEHSALYGELLPTVFFGEVAEWLARTLNEEHDANAAVVPVVLDVMECFLIGGGSDVKDLVTTGFLEGLPPDVLAEGRLEAMLGPALRGDLNRLGQTG